MYVNQQLKTFSLFRNSAKAPKNRVLVWI